MSEGTALLVGVDDGVATALADVTLDRVSGIEAACAALAERPDCVVGALDLPDGTGSELAEVVAEADALLPVVFVDAAPRSEGAPVALDAGAAAYVQWPGEDGAYRLQTAVASASDRYRRQHDRSRLPADAPDEGVVLREGRIDAASAGAGALLGTPELEGLPFVDLVADADVEAIRACLEGTGRDGTRAVEFRPAADDRRTIAARVRRSDRDGAVVARLHDATERADRRDRLEVAEAQLSSLLQNVPMSIYFKDEQGRHERVSDHITHTDPEDYIMNDEGKVHPHAEDVVGKTDYDLYAPAFAEDTYADDMEVMQSEEPVINRIESGTTSLGEPLYTSTTKVPRYDDAGEVVGLVGVTIDVTERVTHREELERQNERLNEFAEVLTHDLRNPLNIAQGYLEVLEERYDEQSVAEAEAALSRMESLIDEIRAFVLEGRLVEEPVAVDLRGAAQQAWSTVETGDATLEIEGDLQLKADNARLRRLLENLFRNATEHATDDLADLTVRVVAGEHEFCVEDDGQGVPGDSTDDVFERGFTTSEDGTGFGLAIVQSIAEAHGWSVDVEESPEGGACFCFSDVVLVESGIGRTIAD